MILKSITSFGALTLNNGTTHRSRAMMNVMPTAPARPVVLPGGQLYDIYATSEIVPLPGKVTYQLLLIQATAALCSGAVDTIAGYIGKKYTLTAVSLAGTTVTASARLESIVDQSPANYPLSSRRLDLAFQLYEEFS